MTLKDFLSSWHNGEERLTVHTSGSTGAPKALLVEKRRMAASARITCDFLGLEPGDKALLCLPLDYIAGKMMVVRALTRGLRLLAVKPSGHPLRDIDTEDGGRWRDLTAATPSGHPLREIDTEGGGIWCETASSGHPLSDIGTEEGGIWCDLAAMVPMQVHHSLQTAEEKAKLWGIRHLIIGGGAIDDELEKQLKDHPHAVWSTYGMTETLSHIALRRLNGPEASSWYTPFEGVAIRQNEDGCLVIDAPEVAESTLVTHDIVEIAADGRRFKVLGRKDNVICSGGIKIQIEEVERLLRPHLTAPFLVSKRPDKVLGEAVALLTEAADLASIEEICRTVLPPYWRPRHYQHTSHLPLTETGKPARAEAERIIRDGSAGRQT